MPEPQIHTRFGLIRHAQTLWNQVKLIQGQRDSELTTKGRQHANQWGRQLKQQTFDRILSSDLGRTLATSEEINQSLQLPMETTPNLRELDWGDWTGKRIQDINVETPALLKSQEAAGWQFCPPGGESRNTARQRAQAALLQAAQKWSGQTILTVTHEGIIKCLLYGLEQREFLPHEPTLIKPYHLHWIVVRDGELAIEEINAIALDHEP
jgi:probable phosphoglycerate mutase